MMLFQRRHPLLAALGLAIVLTSTACSDEETCSSDGDCFAGESCLAGQCVTPSEATDAGTDAAADAGSEEDASSPPADADEPGDMDDGTTDMATEDPDAAADDAGGAACVVDPFEVDACAPDDNDRFAEILESPGGCQPDGFVALDFTKTFRKCAVEETDLYTQTITQCDQELVLKVTMTPLQVCAPDLIGIEMRVGGLRCSTQSESPDVRCGWENGAYVANFLVPSNGSLSSVNIDIETPDRADIDFEYDLRVELANPGL